MMMIEFIAVPMIAFFLTFTVGYIMLSIFSFFRKSLW